MLPSQGILMAEPYYNPGNIQDGGQAGRTGKTYGNGRFPIFDTPQMGIRAMARDLRTKINRHKGDVSKIMNQYAPRSENPATYEQYVLDKVGPTVSEDNLGDLIRAMIRFENKREVAESYLSRPEIFDEGIRLSKIDLPSNASYSDAQRIVAKEELPAGKSRAEQVKQNAVPRTFDDVLRDLNVAVRRLGGRI
jgi:hypothetical protein